MTLDAVDTEADDLLESHVLGVLLSDGDEFAVEGQVVATERSVLPFPAGFTSLLRPAAGALAYLLVASTVVSMLDRATTPFRSRGQMNSSRGNL
jgi:hypothetical protein